MGLSSDALEVLKTVLEETQKVGKAVVLDADALNLIAGNVELQAILRGRNSKHVIMTPHIGELSRLSGYNISYIKSHAAEVAKEIGLDYDSIMVCKDARTLIYAEGQPLYLNISGNSGMATAGSGDVLSGVIGALLAQGMPAFHAAAVGVYLHGLAGDAAACKYTEYGVTATGIIAQIAEIMKGS